MAKTVKSRHLTGPSIMPGSLEWGAVSQAALLATRQTTIKAA